MSEKEKRISIYMLWGGLVLALFTRLILIVGDFVTFNGDEAIVGLMAKHILQGENPIFFYGQAYMGSLDAYLISIVYRMFGVSVDAIRWVQTGLFLGLIVSTYWLAKLLSKDGLVAGISALLISVPPVLLTTYTTASLGGYGEALLFGNLILGLGYLVILGDHQEKSWLWLLLGGIGGLAFWTLGISAIYILTIGVLGIWQLKWEPWQNYLIAGAGFFMGSMPWWVYNLKNDWGAMLEFFTETQESFSLLDKTIGFVFIGIPGLVGMRSPGMSTFFSMPLILLIAVFYAGVLIYAFNERKSIDWAGNEGKQSFLLVFMIVFLGVFLLSRYGFDATGRYLLPLYIPLIYFLAVVISSLIRNTRWVGVGVLMIYLGISIAGNWITAVSPEKITTQLSEASRFDNDDDQALIEFLSQNQLEYGYTNYWVSFRLAFLSDEELIYAAKLPYREDLTYNPLANRYLPYGEIVEGIEQTNFITAKQPELDMFLTNWFMENQINYQEKQIGIYRVYFDLSHPVTPDAFGFSEIK